MISVRGAREHNLQCVDVDIPRDRFTVVTGLSGSGKSSLAFDTIYAEGQRRFLESLSAFSRRFVVQLHKPAVDLVHGLSPVISIEQKTITRNPRSTVGTMTDIYDYLRSLFAAVGAAHCPYCGGSVPVRTAFQMAEHLLGLPRGTTVEMCAPVFKVYGEDFPYLLGDIRTRGYRMLRVDDDLRDISEDLDLDEGRAYALDVVVDRFVIQPGIDKNLVASINNGLRIGEGFLRWRITGPDRLVGREARLFADFACAAHAITMGDLQPYYFSFNEPDSACGTCLGLGTYLKVHPNLLVPDRLRTIRSGAFIPEAFKYDKNTWSGRLMYSLAAYYGFSLDTPFTDLAPDILDVLFYGSGGERFPLVLPPGAAKSDPHTGKLFRFDGIITTIERRYRHYRRQRVAHTWMEDYLRRVMVENTCPDCSGVKLRRQRLLVTIGGRTIHDLGQLSLRDLRDFLAALPPAARQAEAGAQITAEILGRLDLLNDIGMDYLSLGRRSSTLSGGESQRVRLSTQIGSGLMGMLYVLDEPSIGLHARDNARMIATLRRLRDIGNTVIVVEHDEETIRAADHLVEMGPGPGAHGGRVIAQGTIDDVMAAPDSLTGLYLTGALSIPMPTSRRAPGGTLVIRGARENNLKHIDVEVPLNVLLCISGVSGSGKSTLINQILFKQLYSVLHDSRVLPGAHDCVEGLGALHDVINIDQSLIGRVETSNPATYTGSYDAIRQLYAQCPESAARGFTASRFSFNVKGGRCEECGGQGFMTTTLQFLPDVETTCQVCKGKRYNEETLEVRYRGKTIADVLDMPVEEAVCFFEEAPLIGHKLRVMASLGLGYLRLGQRSTTISGGEAQRVKLAHALSKVRRGGRNLYILDEPTTGLHLADIQKLLDSLNRLVDAGNSVIVIEHHLDVLKSADYIIDLGPEGGRGGGRIVASGSPEEVAQSDTHTGRYLRERLTRAA